MEINFYDIIKKPYIKEIVDSIPISAEYEKIELKTTYYSLKNGIRLANHIAFPVGKYNRMPVLFIRTPYGKDSLRFFFEMAFYGYICVAQDCRGRGESQGEWVSAENERADGIESLKALEAEPWCGNIALTGSSYLSMNQFLIADCLGEKVKMLNIENYSPYRYDLLYTGGMFHHEAYSGWTAYNTGLKNPPFSADEMYEKFINYRPLIEADKAIAGIEIPWFRQWISGVLEKNQVWHKSAYGLIPPMVEKINVPILFNGGWYDPHIGGMIRAWENLRPEIRNKSAFIISPTNHKQSLCGDYATENEFEFCGKHFVVSKLNYFEHFLKGKAFFTEGSCGKITAFEYGTNKYVCCSNIKKGHRILFLNCNEKSLAATDKKGSIKYIYDPLNPVISRGSDFLMTDYMYHKNKDTCEGMRLQKSPDYREDVISFVSAPFEEDFVLNKKISFELQVSSTAKDSCFCVKLCMVENGKGYFLRQSASTLCVEMGKEKEYIPNNICTLYFDFAPIFAVLKKGCCLRIDISSSDFPVFYPHPNTKQLWCCEKSPVTAQQTIYGGKLLW